jgi:hypothetical protein
MACCVAGDGIEAIGVPFRSVEGESTMRALRLAGAMALCVMVFSGCTMSRPYKSYSDEVDSWSYPKRFAITWMDWGMNLVDIFSLEVGAGECIGVDLQPTKVLQTGALFGDVGKFGWRNRGLGFYHEVQKEGGIGWAYYRSRRFEPIMGTRRMFERAPLFEGFPIRTNEEGHWMDVGGEVGLVFCEVSARVSPKKALNFGVNTLMLPVNLIFRYPFKWIGVRLPEVDLCGEDTPSRVQKKYDLRMIVNPEGFIPAEVLNELWEVPY